MVEDVLIEADCEDEEDVIEIDWDVEVVDEPEEEVLVALEAEVVEEAEDDVVVDCIETLQVLTSSTASCPFASLIGVSTITQVSVITPRGLHEII